MVFSSVRWGNDISYRDSSKNVHYSFCHIVTFSLQITNHPNSWFCPYFFSHLTLFQILLRLLDECADSEAAYLPEKFNKWSFLNALPSLIENIWGEHRQRERIWSTRLPSSLPIPFPAFILVFLIPRTPTILPTNRRRPTHPSAVSREGTKLSAMVEDKQFQVFELSSVGCTWVTRSNQEISCNLTFPIRVA